MRYLKRYQTISWQHQVMVLLAALAAGIIVYALETNANYEFFMYPMKLFNTWVHEASHAITAIITGGGVQKFIVRPDSSGVTYTGGDIRALTLMAGYIGSAIFGSILIFFANRFRWAEFVNLTLGLTLIILSLRYAAVDENGYNTTVIVGLGFGIVLLILGVFFPLWLNTFVANFLGISLASQGILLLNDLTNRSGLYKLSDATMFHDEIAPILSPAFIAGLWTAIAWLFIAYAVYWGLYKTIKGGRLLIDWNAATKARKQAQ